MKRLCGSQEGESERASLVLGGKGPSGESAWLV